MHNESLPMTLEYRAWLAMKQRCYNKNRKDYMNYGGRGIRVCSRWLYNYKNFLEDMGRKPTSKHTLGRLNHNRHYQPNNCEWQTWTKQERNRPGFIKSTIAIANEIRNLRGKGYRLDSIARRVNINKSVVYNIIYRGDWT
jgi:hypothetical protein